MVAVRVVALALSAALWVGTSPLSTAGGSPVGPSEARRANQGAAGIGDAYFPKDGNGGYDVIRYNIHDRYRLKAGRLTGWTRVTARAKTDLTRFNLDFLLPVSKVRVNRAGARFAKPDKHELKVWPSRKIRSGQKFTVKVTYAGVPGSIGYLGEMNWLATRKEVVAMNQPHMAPWWFPANDHPQDKAKMRIHLTVPRGKQAIANGRLVRKSKRADTTTWHWRAREPMIPYLAFFAAGEFAIRQGESFGLPWLNAVSKQLTAPQQARSFALLRRSASVDDWLSSELGPYPFSITGGLVTGLNPGFALENQTRPTYPYLGNSGQATLVHEQAHQWFGNDVAINRWRDIWLNEGFATYMEQRYAETHGGVSTPTWLTSAYAVRAANASFWRVRVARPGSGRIFSGPVYVRGAMTLAALRNRIGDDTFADLLRGWLSLTSGGNGTTEEFIALAEDMSGEDLGSFFKAWLFSATKPAKSAQNGF